MRRVAAAVGGVFVVLIFGSIGFQLLTDESWLDSIYRTFVTVTLTGSDTRPETAGARILTILLVLSGVTIFAYVAAVLVEAIARGVIGDVWREKRRRREIDALRDHYIICGFGRVGQQIAEEFRRAGVPYVVIDYSDVALTAAQERDERLIAGSGTKDENLVASGIERAKGLVPSSDSGPDLSFEEIVVTPESGQAGKSIRELHASPEGGAVIVGLRRRDGTFDTTPAPDVVLQ